MASIGSSISQDGTTVTIADPTTQSIENVTILVANTEQSYTFPANTKEFMVKPRGLGHVKLADTVGLSGTKYLTIHAGAFYSSGRFSAASKTIYFQSPLAGLVVELDSWA